jgi:hypothetical protein
MLQKISISSGLYSFCLHREQYTPLPGAVNKTLSTPTETKDDSRPPLVKAPVLSISKALSISYKV